MLPVVLERPWLASAWKIEVRWLNLARALSVLSMDQLILLDRLPSTRLPLRSRRSTAERGPARPSPAHETLLPRLPGHLRGRQNQLPSAERYGEGTLSITRYAVQLDSLPVLFLSAAQVPAAKSTSGHLIRRLDTDAVLASSLYRVAFPSAPTESENEEMTWDTEHHDELNAGYISEGYGLAGTVRPVCLPLDRDLNADS